MAYSVFIFANTSSSNHHLNKIIRASNPLFNWTQVDWWFRACVLMGVLSDMHNSRLCMRRECRERFPRHRGLAIPHVPLCMLGSITSGFLWSRWRGKRSRYSRRMRHPQLKVTDMIGTWMSDPYKCGSTDHICESEQPVPSKVVLISLHQEHSNQNLVE